MGDIILIKVRQKKKKNKYLVILHKLLTRALEEKERWNNYF